MAIFVASIEGGLSYVDGGCNPAIFNAQMSRARLKVMEFANILRRECHKESGITHVGLLMEKRPYFYWDSHVACALASMINEVFFADFELPQFGSNLPSIAMTFEKLNTYLEGRGEFPHLKDFQAWMTKKDSTLCMALELEQEDQVSDGVKIRSLNGLKDSKEKFYAAAQNIWLLHGLAHSMNPTPKLMKVQRGTAFDPARMQAYHSGDETSITDSSIERPVEFTVHPGFELKVDICTADVYLSKIHT